MLIFGHVGIGLRITQPWARRLPKRFIALGALMPDLIDKPIHLYLSWVDPGLRSTLGIFTGPRGLGHAGAILVLLALVAVFFRIRWLGALCLGMATHLLLDSIGDRIIYGDQGQNFTQGILFWPLEGWKFPRYPFPKGALAPSPIQWPYLILTETLGLVFLMLEVRRLRRRARS